MEACALRQTVFFSVTDLYYITKIHTIIIITFSVTTQINYKKISFEMILNTQDYTCYVYYDYYPVLFMCSLIHVVLSHLLHYYSMHYLLMRVQV